MKNIANPDDVANELFSNEIFTEGMKDEVEVENLKEKKVRKLLDILPRRGPEAFQVFIKVLQDTKNDHVAEQLKSGASEKNNSYQRLEDREDDLPQTWPDPISLEGNLTVKPLTQRVQKFQESGCYKMSRKPRGKVLIINNKIFFGPLEEDEYGKKRVTLGTREGTEQDESKIKAVFEQMYFVVDVHNDKKGEEIKTKLKEEVKKDFHRTADCFVLVIMTHGTAGAIYGVDGKTVSIEEIKMLLSGENFPAMAEKPKILLIQACRGETKDQGVKETTDIGKEIKSTGAILRDLSLDTVSDSKSESVTPTMSHMVVAMASTLGMVSYRNRMYGSWFLQAVAYVFAKYSHTNDIHQMLTKVNQLVSRGRARDSKQNKEFVAISESSYTLSKNLYFCPGYFTEEVPQSRIQQASS